MGVFLSVTAQDCPHWPVSAPFHEPCFSLSLPTETSFSDQRARLPSVRETWSPGTAQGLLVHWVSQPVAGNVCVCVCASVCACVLGGRGVWGLGTQRQHIRCRVLGSGLGFHGNGQPPSAGLFSLGQLTVIRPRALGQRRRTGGVLHQTLYGYLGGEKHQTLHGYLGDENFGQHCPHCPTEWTFPGAPGTLSPLAAEWTILSERV